MRLLGEVGYRVLEAPCPLEALELARDDSEAIRLLLTDVRMPQMTGIELARRFEELVPDASILLMSGYYDGDEVRHPLLSKPFTPGELYDAVGHALTPA